jgi:methylglyoxal synthase
MILVKSVTSLSVHPETPKAAESGETQEFPSKGSHDLRDPRAAREPREMPARRRIALIAHDNRKADLLEWARYNRLSLVGHDLLATGTTGKLVREELDLDVTTVESGPLGGDVQIGAMITDGAVDMLVFFWDPLEPQPHDPDVKALLRVAVVWNIPLACNRASADFLISSPLMTEPYERATHHYGPAMKPEARATVDQPA